MGVYFTKYLYIAESLNGGNALLTFVNKNMVH